MFRTSWVREPGFMPKLLLFCTGTLMRLATGFCVAFWRASVLAPVSASASSSSDCALPELVCPCDRDKGANANSKMHRRNVALGISCVFISSRLRTDRCAQENSQTDLILRRFRGVNSLPLICSPLDFSAGRMPDDIRTRPQTCLLPFSLALIHLPDHLIGSSH